MMDSQPPFREQRSQIRLPDKQSNERGPPRKRSPTFYRNARLLAVFTSLAVASTNFYTLSNHVVITNQNSHDDSSSSSSRSWSKRKIANVASRAAPLEEKDNVFLRTGKTPMIQSENNASSSMKASKRKTITHRRKHNRLIRGTHLTLAEMNGWPPIQEIITKDGNKIAAHEDISWLLDFAIIGFPKTGTTSMLRHLSEITHMPPSESCSLTDDNSGIVKLVKDMYSDRNKRLEVIDKNGHVFDDSTLRGLKCPQDLSSEVSMHNYAKYFPKTKLIVGVRHPVRWFESLYNFRVSNVPWKKMLHTSKLTRGCTYGSQGVCAHRANFADYLSQLGKTPMDTSDERNLLSMGLSPVKSPVGKVFLYDVSQLSESEEDGAIIQSSQFRRDLQDFLGLNVDIPPFPRIDTSGRFDFLEPVKKQTEQDRIDICDADHDRIRQVLMDKARIASRWMKDYFLKSTDVVVSNREHFLEILDGWNEDPCNVVVVSKL